MKSLTHLPPLREIIATYELSARKRLGQNYLLDPNITDKIARLAGPLENFNILEIGPGPGGLTRSLVKAKSNKVVVVEKDARFLPALHEIAAVVNNLEIIHGDAFDDSLQLNLKPPVKIISNLPFNAATGLLTKWLEPPEWPPFWESLILMFQQETAERITANPGSKSYGRLSILSQWRSTAKLIFKVPSSAFVPRPKVDAAVVRIDRIEEPPDSLNANVLSFLTKVVFGQRRKMLRTSLKSYDPNIITLLRGVGIRPDARPESLSVNEFCRLTRLLQSKVSNLQ